MEKIEEGFDVFLHDGEKAFGAVRQVGPKGAIVVYVENAGDFVVPLGAIRDVHDEKVILDSSRISTDLRTSIARAHRREDPTV